MDQFLFDLNLTLLWLRFEESWELARSCPKEEEFSQHAPLHKAARHILHFQSVVSAARLNPRGCRKAHKSKGLDFLCHPWEWPLSFLRPTYENVKKVVDHLPNQLDNIVCRRIWHEWDLALRNTPTAEAMHFGDLMRAMHHVA